MNHLEQVKQELIKELGAERYNKLVKEIEQQHKEDAKQREEDEKRRKLRADNQLGKGGGHTCGEDPYHPCAECEKAFPIQAIPLCSKSVQ